LSELKKWSVMNFFHILLFLTILIVTLSVFGLLWANFTGRDARAYPVLPPDTEIEIAGKTMRISDVALEYQPAMNIRKTNPSPPLLWTWYEAIRTNSGVDLVYYQDWEDEINPDPLYHGLYRIFRSAYYGSPVRDIEYFQISISPSTGEVQNMMFETSPGDDYFVTYSKHLVARYQKTAGGTYDVIIGDKSGNEISKTSGINPIFHGSHIQVLAQTWNHLTRLLTISDTDLIQLPTDLKFLLDDVYSSYKFVRKSQGDHLTRENPWIQRIGMLGYLIIIPGMIYLYFKSRKSKK
jgi:hypothetical protein